MASADLGVYLKDLCWLARIYQMMAKADRTKSIEPSARDIERNISLQPQGGLDSAISSSSQLFRVILQNRTSLHYFRSGNDWTENFYDAYDFGQLIIALDFARTAKLSNLDILLCFDNPKYDLRFCASL
jgi:hypothetical protein